MIPVGSDFTINLGLDRQSIPLHMTWVEPANFILGENWQQNRPYNTRDYSPDYSEDFYEGALVPAHQMPCNISQGFWIGSYPITQEQWSKLGFISTFHKDELKASAQWFEHPNKPIYGLSWTECMRFCQKLNINYKNKLPAGYHFSLPTELQWEYICRTGGSTEHKILSEIDFSNLIELKNIKKTGQNQPNYWGVHDMIGVVRQICYDIAAHYLYSEDIKDFGAELPFITSGNTVFDWVGNAFPENWNSDFYINEIVRVVRGNISSVHREVKSHGMDLAKDAGFRVALRPIIDKPFCDLDDPWLEELGINILG